ncbi:MAG: thioredoxin domain-containing protein [Bacteroidota bacterium]|nr:thioredoxin domain-containing protein [Bacteroidota bacterium]
MNEIKRDNFKERVLESDLPVMLAFKANWCRPCHIIEPSLKQISRDNDGYLNSFIIDNDRERTIAEEYGVHLLPTILFFKKGRLMDSLIGTHSKEKIQERVDKLLKNGKENK